MAHTSQGYEYNTCIFFEKDTGIIHEFGTLDDNKKWELICRIYHGDKN